MNEDKFNVSMNKINSDIEDLKNASVFEICDEIDIICKRLDEFKEECLNKLKFNSKTKKSSN